MIKIGNCELYKGDTIEVMKTIPDKCIDMILCDLPYGTTACKWDTIIPFEPLWEQYKRLIKPNGAIVLTSGQPFTSALIMSNPIWFKYCWIWEKTKVTGVLNAKHQPLRNYEDVCVFASGKTDYFPQGTNECNKTLIDNGKSENYGKKAHKPYKQTKTGYPRQVLKISSEGSTVHPTQKPVPLFEYLIKTYTNEGMMVLDNTMGSGTTGVACVNINRNFIGIERDDNYFDIACKRIEQATAQQRMFP